MHPACWCDRVRDTQLVGLFMSSCTVANTGHRLDVFGSVLYGASYTCTWKYTVLALPFGKTESTVCRVKRAALGQRAHSGGHKGRWETSPSSMRIYTWSHQGQAGAPQGQGCLRSARTLKKWPSWRSGGEGTTSVCPPPPPPPETNKRISPQASPSEKQGKVLNQKVVQGAERLGQSGPWLEGKLLGEGRCGFQKPPEPFPLHQASPGNHKLFPVAQAAGKPAHLCCHLGIGC